jgi:glycogen debranching enzyme
MQQVRDALELMDQDVQADQSYIETHTSLVERRLRTLKSGESFAVMDISGDMGFVPEGPEGLYHRDMRHLSRFALSFTGLRPLLLSSVVHDDNAALSVDLTNPDIEQNHHLEMPRDVIALHRTKFIWKDVSYERIGMRNYDIRRRNFSVDLHFDADFHDLFEVRGMKRRQHGRRSADIIGDDKVVFSYEGLDGITRRTVLSFNPSPTRLEKGFASFEIGLDAGERRSIIVDIQCIARADVQAEFAPASAGATPPFKPPMPFVRAYRNSRRSIRRQASGIARIDSSNEVFDEVLRRSTTDIYMLVSETEHGPYPFAGIPWYSTAFGRDGLITAMLMLWADPEIARGVLQYLAATQATAHDPAADAQPGKILHETRAGEMAMLGEVPFRRYYGTVDATPLFVMLAGRYFERTGDRETIARIWPNIEAALDWCDKYGDSDGDGFVEYHRETEAGLANQGWKDSHDSMFHADGACAEGPIALVEVQGYVYAAKAAASAMAQALGRSGFAERLAGEAERLREAFDAAFWCEEIATYAMALDGAKRPLRVRGSNAGHALFSGIARPERAAIVARTLMNEDSFSGWGIRTIARGEARYNPMSYHNGSVWPHDNALIALGFGRYGLKEEAARVFTAMFDAAAYQDLRRLPELFCGFLRRPRRGPTAYPVACSPQAWAAAVPFGLLQASLGLELPFTANEVRFQDPHLPHFLSRLQLEGLRLGESRLDLRLDRHGDDMTVSVLARTGDAQVVLVK